jgi:hypothetical protein
MSIVNRLTISKIMPAYWRVTINNPPINLYDPEMFAELNVLMDKIDADKELKVVVFESASPDYFIAHYDLERGEVIPDQPGAAEFSAWPKFVTRLAESRVISVAKLRGRARELLLVAASERCLVAAEQCFSDAIEEARQQGALFWELRITLSLAQLEIRQDRHIDARLILTNALDLCADCPETMDALAAKMLLSSLGDNPI